MAFCWFLTFTCFVFDVEIAWPVLPLSEIFTQCELYFTFLFGFPSHFVSEPWSFLTFCFKLAPPVTLAVQVSTVFELFTAFIQMCYKWTAVSLTGGLATSSHGETF